MTLTPLITPLIPLIPNLRQTLENYLVVYNHHLPQKALGHITPIAAMKQWQKKEPDLFVKRVYNQAGLDI